MTMEYFYWTDGDEVRGPLSLVELGKLDDHEFSRTLVCAEGQSAWQPLAEVLSGSEANSNFKERFAGQRPMPAESHSVSLIPTNDYQEEKVRKGATILNAGWSPSIQRRAITLGSVICLLLGACSLCFPLRAFLFFTPFFFMALVLSVTAVIQTRTIGAIALLAITLIAPPVEWLCSQRPTSGKSITLRVASNRPLQRSVKKEESPESVAPFTSPAANRPVQEPHETPESQVAKSGTGQTVDDLRRQFDAVVQESAAVDRRAALRGPAPNDRSPVDVPPSPTPRRLPEKTWDKPHIYLHITDESQRKTAESIKLRLSKEGWMVMGIENVSTNPFAPASTPELRYFTSDDGEEAQEIASKIRPLLGGGDINPNIPESGGYVSHSRQYEFWFSRSFGNESKQGPLTADQIDSWDLAHVQTAIDEIYARHGTEFPKRETQAWAERQSWYQRVPGLSPDAAEQSFTADERFNIELLATRRNALKTFVHK